jgi:hypothetical protein
MMLSILRISSRPPAAAAANGSGKKGIISGGLVWRWVPAASAATATTTVPSSRTARSSFSTTTTTEQSASQRGIAVRQDPSRTPFGLTGESIRRLQRSIEASHREFSEDWGRRLLTSTDDAVVEVRKALREGFVRACREESVRAFGLWATARGVLSGRAAHERTEEEGFREITDELIVASGMWTCETLIKKALYEIPAVYSHVLDETFNRKLFQSSSSSSSSPNINENHSSNSNYMLASGAITPQLAKALRLRSDALLTDSGLETSVKVRQEPSPPVLLGYASRLQMALLDGQGRTGLPKELALLHVPGGAVDLRSLPVEHQFRFDSVATVCVHVAIDTHERYTFVEQTSGRNQPVETDTPRVLTLLGHFDIAEPGENLRKEVNLAMFEDQVLGLFTHNPTKYRELYPDGCPLNNNLGIRWQLADIDFLVARTGGWIDADNEEEEKGTAAIKVNDRFCYQPPEGLLEFDEEDKNTEPFLRRGTHVASALVVLQSLFLLLLGLLYYFEELPGLVKRML